MKKLISILMVAIPQLLHAQENSFEYFVTINTNLYAPIASDKQMFPILGYNADMSPKLLIGGFGAGFTMMKAIQERSSLKLASSFSRIVYWDESVELRSPQNEPLGTFSTSSTDLTLGVTGTWHYAIRPRFSVGAGLGVQALLMSTFRFRDKMFEDESSIGSNKFYKPLMPTLPVEAMYQHEKWYFCLRYEHALLNRYKKNMADDFSEKYGLIFFEFGIKVK